MPPKFSVGRVLPDNIISHNIDIKDIMCAKLEAAESQDNKRLHLQIGRIETILRSRRGNHWYLGFNCYMNGAARR